MREEKFLLEALDKAALSIAILDKEQKIRWVNDVFEEWHDHQDLIGKDFSKVATNPTLAKGALHLLSTSEKSQQIYQTKSKSGRTIRTTISQLKAQHYPYVVMESDVTNLVKAHHYQKVFSASMGHDTKGHLRDSIRLINALYQAQTEDQVLQEKLKDILFLTEHAFDIVKNLNDLGKPLLGEASPTFFSHFDLTEQLDKVRNRFVLFLSYHKITLKSVFTDQFSFRAEPEMMRTVLRNLISNSLAAIIKQQKEFDKIGGTIEISAEKQEKEIIIQVSDDGGGISPKVVTALFSDIEKEVFSLGTMLCKELILAHKGDIFIDKPKLSFDTTITIIIPRKL